MITKKKQMVSPGVPIVESSIHVRSGAWPCDTVAADTTSAEQLLYRAQEVLTSLHNVASELDTTLARLCGEENGKACKESDPDSAPGFVSDLNRLFSYQENMLLDINSKLAVLRRHI